MTVRMTTVPEDEAVGSSEPSLNGWASSALLVAGHLFMRKVRLLVFLKAVCKYNQYSNLV